MYFDCGSSIQSYASLVFLGRHASRKVQSWQKRCHTFSNKNIVLLPIVSGKLNCVPKPTLCELYGVKFWE